MLASRLEPAPRSDHTIACAGSAFLALALIACDGGGGQACTTTSECPDALACVGGVCVTPDCEAGTEGCTCGAGDRCARGADGMPLVCTGGVCGSLTCPGGDRTCVCIDGETCTGEGDVCEGGRCVAGDCQAGAADCPCLVGSCDPGLYCFEGSLCVDGAGYPGGACLENSRCHPGALCDTAFLECVRCEPGTEGCSCEGDTCASGLGCHAGLCVTQDRVPPRDPVCFTPCSTSAVLDDTLRHCEEDGLMRGCIDDKECVDGSCVEPGTEPPSCGSEVDCPDYQTCLSGRCYSNCEGSADCSPGLGCWRHVCRVPCESAAGGSVCGSGEHCDAPDGASGYCAPLPETLAPADPVPQAAFELTEHSIELTNVSTGGSFDIRPGAGQDSPIVFTVRKVRHTLTRADGTTETVEAPRDAASGEYLPCDAARGECPLSWLELSDGITPTREPALTLQGTSGCEGGACPRVTISRGAATGVVRWAGELEITSPRGTDRVEVSYVELPEGAWVGSMHYFGTFEPSGNALLLVWDGFKRGALEGGWDQMQAVLTSTKEESWRFPRVMERCRVAHGGSLLARCYPYTTTLGIQPYVNEDSPIPRGVTEFPFTMNLRRGATGRDLVGRIESTASLHYPGNPEVTMQLATDPQLASSCSSSVPTDCVVSIQSLSATSVIGGRYAPGPALCASGFARARVPWLVAGFEAGMDRDEDGALFLETCLSNTLPFPVGSSPDAAARSTSLAWGNPIPDGRARPRTLALIDGALINQRELFALFEERVESFIPGADPEVSAYGYLLLERHVADLDTRDEDENGVIDAFEGTPTPALPAPPPVAQGARCDPNLIEQILPAVSGTNGLGGLDDTSLSALVRVLMNGTEPSEATLIDHDDVHYFCEDTGLFDGGAGDDGTLLRPRIECPVGSRVTFFVLRDRSQASIAAEPCQEDVTCTTDEGGTTCTGGTCRETLNHWADAGIIDTYPDSFCDRQEGELPCFEPLALCATTGVFCDDDRSDLTAAKNFFEPALGSAVRAFRPLETEIEAAFRYRTRFTSSTGSRVGFAPAICIPDSDRVRYCYDPPVIEEIRARTDCLIDAYSSQWERLDPNGVPPNPPLPDSRTELASLLRGSFSALPGGQDGFERLYAELMVMMGDEALTRAFASRFDLAGVGGAAFQGDLFEAGGINLAGVAGFEMDNLYRAVQYYQLALDRLYALGPDMATALSRGPTDSSLNFLSPATVPLYLERLIRASTQKARAQSEIAKHYQSFNRPELARRVIERAYTSAQLESSILTRLMTQLADLSTPANRAQIELTITQAQRRYRMALLEMRDLYASISDEMNVFGFAPDYIPFPVTDSSVLGRNAVEVLLDLADSRVNFARVRELDALSSNRSFQTATAEFHAELVRIRNTYEAQLSESCGTFTSQIDGLVYAATRRNASHSPRTELLGDPCGLVGNGNIHEAMAALEDAYAQERLQQTRFRDVLAAIQIEQTRVEEMCDLIQGTADYQFLASGVMTGLRGAIAGIEASMRERSRMLAAEADKLVALSCVPSMGFMGAPDFSSCQNQRSALAARSNTSRLDSILTEAGHLSIVGLEATLAGVNAESGRWVTMRQCDSALIDSNARTATQLLQLHEINIEAARAAHQSELRLSEIGHLYDQARRIQAEQEEMEELSVDVEAARNDPNVRVYRNDAIINADVAFQDAIRAAYRATRVLEYYTSMSYPRMEQLFLIRMVTAGDYNLENYMLALRNAYLDFEETYGPRDARVHVVSLRDDILAIPRLGPMGPLDQSERIDLMRQRLQSSDLLDENGYLTIGFSTGLEQLSPLTRAHRIDFIESEVIGSDVGDTVGRVYVRQAGTGVVHGVRGDTRFYVFPERTSVVNTYFNGARVFPPNVYQSHRLQERPFLNTSWEIVINQRDELANRDIDLGSLTDIRLYLYYSDFTVF